MEHVHSFIVIHRQDVNSQIAKKQIDNEDEHIDEGHGSLDIYNW